MKKKIHLLCNAHLDPVWLWQWKEGLAEAISTFRVAADFCEKYDGFIFNHNESLLYEWVEEYEPELFERIKKLVAQGKWQIMGGWYLQPDCVMTSGESLLSQIDIGREYFKEKFGVEPKTAVNLDPFGHTRGLVQILKAKGYDNYMFMRPFNFTGEFIWEGFDGSQVFAHGITLGYNSSKGKAVEKINRIINETDKDKILCLWGIGNHGGGPSEKDLNDINEYMKTSEHEISHSYFENYSKEIDKSKLEVFCGSIIPTMVGCYTSMTRIKQANRKLENLIASTEKIMSYADMQTDFKFDKEELLKAKKALAFCQFHDILPGSAIKPVENDSLRTLSYGEEIADKLYTKAFFKLCSGQAKAENGTIPIMAFNPHPFPVEDDFDVSFMLEDQNHNDDEITLGTVYDENGNQLSTQNEKTHCTIDLDWAKRITFHATLQPSSVTRFNCKLTTYKKSELEQKQYTEIISISNERMSVSISRKTGLIENYTIDSKNIIKNSGILEVYKDNEDPWGMTVNSFKNFEGAFRLMTDEEANEFRGYVDEKYSNVLVVEDGDVRTKIQTLWIYKSNKALIEYSIPKKGIYIDINITIYSNEPNIMIKYRLDTDFNGKAYGQTAFGTEELYTNGDECVFHKWCGIKNDNANISVLNNGTYGGSFYQNKILISLLRTPVYAAHPIDKKQIVPHNRSLEHIDIGERRFSFRLSNFEEIDRKAQVYNEAPSLLSFFPSGNGEKTDKAVEIENPNIILSSIRKENEKYLLTLFNSSAKAESTTIKLNALNKDLVVDLEKFELKFIEI